MRDICCHFNLCFVHSLGKEFKSCEFMVLSSLKLSPAFPQDSSFMLASCGSTKLLSQARSRRHMHTKDQSLEARLLEVHSG